MFSALQSFRGIGAILVLLSHTHINSSNDRIYHSGGPAGVEYFLLLSGFVMCVAYEYAFLSGQFQYRGYLRKRLIRVLPMCWLGLLFASIPAIMLDAFSPTSFLAGVFVLNSWLPAHGLGINTPAWCLAPILLFYLLFPLLYRFMSRFPRRFVAAVLALAAALTLANSLLPDVEQSLHYTRYFPPARLFDFMSGMLLWRAYKRCSSADFLADISYSRRSMVEVVVLALWVAVAIFVARIDGDSVWITHGAWLLPSALIIFVFALFNEKGGVISRMLS